jgi:hypothetical protein
MTESDVFAAPSDSERRTPPPAKPAIEGVPVREDDIESTGGIHWVAGLFRVLSVVLLLLMIVQVALGVSGTVGISYGVLVGEAIRLTIYAALLWGGGDLANLFVQSHRDLRATRILVARLAYLATQQLTGDQRAPGRDDAEIRRGREDGGF